MKRPTIKQIRDHIKKGLSFYKVYGYTEISTMHIEKFSAIYYDDDYYHIVGQSFHFSFYKDNFFFTKKQAQDHSKKLVSERKPKKKKWGWFQPKPKDFL